MKRNRRGSRGAVVRPISYRDLAKVIGGTDDVYIEGKIITAQDFRSAR